MNHLAHAHLAAHGDAAFVAGSVLGDFIKGPVQDGQWPAVIAAGIRLHRRIDGFTDRHPIVAECRTRFPAEWRRLAGPALDVVWDHCLSRQWSQWHAVPLAQFTATTCRALQQFAACFPLRAHGFSRWLQQEAILDSYSHADGIEAALALMQHRLPHSAGLAACTRAWLQQEYDWLESRFAVLYAGALDLARQHNPCP